NFNKTVQITEWKEDSIKSSKPLKSKLPSYVEIYTLQSGDDEATIRAKSYIRRFHKLAISEMKKFGVPASIKMAQALLESSSGNSKLALQNNNHFGIKCFSKNCKPGHCTNLHDDHHKDFFRKYDNAWHSWRAHSRLLSSDKYNSLKSLGKDYKKWAKHLKVKGYATDPAYPEKLINLIEKYQLNLLDRFENP
ncbi:MAG: glucosaminidase domain-containing protein, partial [Saprospiraceae bacterium]|nr:glucosaminidase domain-containing protein [Saprospiraceae bacterium]